MSLTTEPNLRQSTSLYANLAHEDLMDIVDRVMPADTPLYSMAGREYELGNTEFSWEVDSWPNPNGALGPGDGYAVQTTEIRDVTSNRRKMGNYGQAFRRGFGAGWIAEQVPNLPGKGRGKLLADGASDAMVLLKQDIETAFASFDQVATADAGGSSGSIMAGLVKLVDASNAYGGASSFAYGKPTDLHSASTGATLTGAMSAVFNLSAVRTIIQALRVAVKRRKDYVLLCGLDLRAQVTSLTDPLTAQPSNASGITATQIRVFKQDIMDNELGISIDVIRTDYGRFLVVDTDFIGKTTLNATGGTTNDTTRSARVYTSQPRYGLAISREKLFKRWGVPFQPDTLQNDGGGTNKQIRCYATMGVYNPVGFGFLQLT